MNGNAIGPVTLQMHGPNSKQVYSVGIDKSKSSDKKFVKLVAELFVMQLLHDAISGKGWGNIQSEDSANCNICKKKFVCEKLMKAHMSSKHNAEGKLICGQCKKPFKTNITLKTHMNKYHPEIIKKTVEIKQGQEPKSIEDPPNKKTEISIENCDAVIFTCIQCNDMFNSENVMKQHMLQVHIVKDAQPVVKAQGDGQCKLCKQEFFTKTAMKSHETKCQQRSSDGSRNIILNPGLIIISVRFVTKISQLALNWSQYKR